MLLLLSPPVLIWIPLDPIPVSPAPILILTGSPPEPPMLLPTWLYIVILGGPILITPPPATILDVSLLLSLSSLSGCLDTCIFSFKEVFLVLLILTSCLCFLFWNPLIYLKSLQNMTLSIFSFSPELLDTFLIFFLSIVHLKVRPSDSLCFKASLAAYLSINPVDGSYPVPARLPTAPPPLFDPIFRPVLGCAA